jgi:hypothetical protein
MNKTHQREELNLIASASSESSKKGKIRFGSTNRIEELESEATVTEAAIDEISSCPMVTLLITTRTTSQTTSHWSEYKPRRSDRNSARAAFWRYKHEESSSAIDPVLIEIDRHPASINILACAGDQDSLLTMD